MGESTAGEVTTLLGSGIPGYLDAPGANARLLNPSGLAISPNGTLLYFSDRANNRIRVVHTTTGNYLYTSVRATV